MKLLLDTHAFVWAASGDARLSPAARAALTDPEMMICVSCVSAWEIAYKQEKGGRLITEPFETLIDRSGFEGVGLPFSTARIAFDLPFHHRDPWDRLLIAQAIDGNMTLLTRDAAIGRYDVRVLW